MMQPFDAEIAPQSTPRAFFAMDDYLSVKGQLHSRLPPYANFEDALSSAVFYDWSIATHTEENVEFYFSVEKFRKTPERERMQVARAIIARFLIRESPKEINLDAVTRIEVLSHIDGDAAPPSGSLFDEAQECIFGLMRNDLWMKFISSAVYARTGPEDTAAVEPVETVVGKKSLLAKLFKHDQKKEFRRRRRDSAIVLEKFLQQQQRSATESSNSHLSSVMSSSESTDFDDRSDDRRTPPVRMQSPRVPASPPPLRAASPAQSTSVLVRAIALPKLGVGVVQSQVQVMTVLIVRLRSLLCVLQSPPATHASRESQRCACVGACLFVLMMALF
jgi:hypothetical protein